MELHSKIDKGLLSRYCITRKCTGVADRAESEINVAGGKPVILVVRPGER